MVPYIYGAFQSKIGYALLMRTIVGVLVVVGNTITEAVVLRTDRPTTALTFIIEEQVKVNHQMGSTGTNT